MDLGLLKGPAELLASKVKAFKNCLELATECLSNKDYMNAEMIYGGILADLHKDCFVDALGLNDLELFSLHSCFAYSSVGTDLKSDKALVILNSIYKPIKLPLVPYLKAFIHITNDRLSFAHDEIECCQMLLDDGYNFKPNNILNEQIIPEINDEFLKLKINGLRFACELLKAREDNEELKKCFKENWLKLGKLCETDFAKVSVKEKETKDDDQAPKEIAEKTEKKKSKNQTGAIKKTDKPQTSQSCKSEIGTQTNQAKVVNVGVQTVDKEISKQVLNAILDIKNKMNNLQSKKDNEIKQLQKKNNELNEKLVAKDHKHEDKVSEFNFLKEQFVSLEKKYEQAQKTIEILQKLLIEQFQQKYTIQKNVYQLFEEKCDYKIVYLSDVQKLLRPADKPTPDECKQEVEMWKSTLTKLSAAKRKFESYYRNIDDLILAKKYVSVKTNDWPPIPSIPNDVQDVIYRNFKIIIQQNKSLQSSPMPTNDYVFGDFSDFKEFENVQNSFVNGYNNHKEDGRTTGSPNFQSKPNSKKQPQRPQQLATNGYHLNRKSDNSVSARSPSSPTSNDKSSKYKSEEELLKFVQIYFKDVGEIELLEALCHVRDSTESSGSVVEMPRKYVIDEIKKYLKKKTATKFGWNSVSRVGWHNDHSDNRCCICFEDYDSSTSHSLPCQHEFHKKCINDWLKRQSACPVCRVHSVIDEEFPPLKT